MNRIIASIITIVILSTHPGTGYALRAEAAAQAKGTANGIGQELATKTILLAGFTENQLNFLRPDLKKYILMYAPTVGGISSMFLGHAVDLVVAMAGAGTNINSVLTTATGHKNTHFILIGQSTRPEKSPRDIPNVTYVNIRLEQIPAAIKEALAKNAAAATGAATGALNAKDVQDIIADLKKVIQAAGRPVKNIRITQAGAYEYDFVEPVDETEPYGILEDGAPSNLSDLMEKLGLEEIYISPSTFETPQIENDLIRALLKIEHVFATIDQDYDRIYGAELLANSAARDETIGTIAFKIPDKPEKPIKKIGIYSYAELQKDHLIYPLNLDSAVVKTNLSVLVVDKELDSNNIRNFLVDELGFSKWDARRRVGVNTLPEIDNSGLDDAKKEYDLIILRRPDGSYQLIGAGKLDKILPAAETQTFDRLKKKLTEEINLWISV